MPYAFQLKCIFVFSESNLSLNSPLSPFRYLIDKLLIKKGLPSQENFNGSQTPFNIDNSFLALKELADASLEHAIVFDDIGSDGEIKLGDILELQEKPTFIFKWKKKDGVEYVSVMHFSSSKDDLHSLRLKRTDKAENLTLLKKIGSHRQYVFGESTRFLTTRPEFENQKFIDAHDFVLSMRQ